MFKSTFAKYLTVFIVILLLSFVLLSGIITTTVGNRINSDREESLIRTSTVLAGQMAEFTSDMPIEEIETFIDSPIGAMSIISLINVDDNVDVIIVNPEGEILLTTVNTTAGDGFRKPITSGELGAIDLGIFELQSGNDGEYLSYFGKIDAVGDVGYQFCAKPIIAKEQIRGYAIALISVDGESRMLSDIRKTIISSSLWVMLAAAVAVYFITERVTNPLKNMTKATKSFAKGDFSTRVTVSGDDEIAELGAAFNNMAESLDNFEKMRNSFLANVSHDLRTPMTTIAGFIDGITSGAIPPEKHDYYLGIISTEVHRLSRLVSELLDISRLESGERKFNFVDFDIAEMARVILISFEKQIEEKNLDVIFEADFDEIITAADKDAIHQVLYNLMHNAIKFSKNGGKFAISVTMTQGKKIRVSVYNEGQGIPKEELPLIFDRFYKADKSRGLDKSGVGLGLYICKTIIDAHGEEIHAESPNSNGAEFWFTLKEGNHHRKNAIGSKDQQ
jgi:signal transduction histidine kinase